MIILMIMIITIMIYWYISIPSQVKIHHFTVQDVKIPPQQAVGKAEMD